MKFPFFVHANRESGDFSTMSDEGENIKNGKGTKLSFFPGLVAFPSDSTE